jgi:hypothetical protein
VEHPSNTIIFAKEESDLEEYSSNSHKSRESKDQSEEKALEPVVSGTTRIQQKSGISKFADSIIAEDLHSVSSFILSDVLIPSFKKAIKDIVTNGIEMLLYGNSSSSKSNSTVSKLSYTSYWSNPKYSEPVHAGSNSAFDFGQIIFDNRGDAEGVLVVMKEILDRYDAVSVADYYELADAPAPHYTANNYGWKNLSNVQVMRWKDGYILTLGKVVPI